MSALREYLEADVAMRRRISPEPMEGYRYASMAEYVLQEGEDFAPAPLTDSEAGWIFGLIESFRFPVKQCYANSQRVVTFTGLSPNPDGHELRYVEGYGLGMIPVLHGWLSLNGKVVDLTMRLQEGISRRSRVYRRRLRDRVLGEFPEGRGYRGVTFETDYVLRRIVETGLMGTLIDDWQNGYPLLREAS